jgi:hypothetical protein
MIPRFPRSWLAGLVALPALLTHSGRARAEEPVAASEPRLMSETAEITSVVDAFDRDDAFDLHLTAGFQQIWKRADIHRETSLNQPGLATGGFVPATENVGTFSQSQSILNLGVDIGLFRDFAITARLPLVLSDARQIDDLGGASKNPQRLQDPSGQQLFTVPFKSPTRSGVDYFALGVNWAILNQQRDSSKPTWVVGVEGRFAVGAPMHACNAAGVKTGAADGASRTCPDPVNPGGADRDPGISRALHAINGKMLVSRRIGYVEPYTGFDVLAEFSANNTSDFGATNGLTGSLVNHPPLVGSYTLGLEVIPWERREQFQRFVADFRATGIYNSPGREYSELFDALGTSQAGSLRNPNPGGYTESAADPTKSVTDPSSPPVYFRGITDQQAFGAFAAQASVTWQAGEYVKFQLGASYRFNQSHIVTAADACNPDVSKQLATSGPCRVGDPTFGQSVTGVPNPNHRDALDTPGHRFSVDNTSITSLWVQGSVMF